MQTMMIRELKKSIPDSNEIIIYDAPPGTSCPVVITMEDADFVVLVTEPTPFGLHDLKITVQLLRDMGKPFGVIINKAGLGDHHVYDYLQVEKIMLLGEIPFSRSFSENYAKGGLVDNIPSDIEQNLNSILQKIKDLYVKTD